MCPCTCSKVCFTLSTFGPPPFDIACKRKKLLSHAGGELGVSSIPTAQLSPQPGSGSEVHSEILEFLSQPVDNELDWTQDVDHPLNAHETNGVPEVVPEAVDVNSVQEGQAILGDIPTTWPSHNSQSSADGCLACNGTYKST